MSDEHVTQQQCKDHHAWRWPAMGVVVSIFLGLGSGVGVALCVAYAASADCKGLQERHTAQEEFIRDSLSELRTDVRGNRDLLTQILRNGNSE